MGGRTSSGADDAHERSARVARAIRARLERRPTTASAGIARPAKFRAQRAIRRSALTRRRTDNPCATFPDPRARRLVQTTGCRRSLSLDPR
jgi:hypothetical protein